jgi:hypothetical protein
VAVRVLEVKAAAATAVVDLHVGARAGAAAIGDTLRLDPVEDRVELGLADPEGVVVMLEIAALVESRVSDSLTWTGAKWECGPLYSSPKIRAKNLAEATLSRAGTIV